MHMRGGMEGKERQSLSKDTRSKRSICTYARMRLAVADLTVLTVPRLPVQRGPAATRCDGSGSLLPDLLRLNLLAWEWSTSSAAALQLWQASPRARTATACVFFLSRSSSEHR